MYLDRSLYSASVQAAREPIIFSYLLVTQNEHQEVLYLNRGKTSVHTISKFRSTVMFVGQNGRFDIMIGQIACQSSSLWRVVYLI